MKAARVQFALSLISFQRLPVNKLSYTHLASKVPILVSLFLFCLSRRRAHHHQPTPRAPQLKLGRPAQPYVDCPGVHRRPGDRRPLDPAVTGPAIAALPERPRRSTEEPSGRANTPHPFAVGLLNIVLSKSDSNKGGLSVAKPGGDVGFVRPTATKVTKSC